MTFSTSPPHPTKTPDIYPSSTCFQERDLGRLCEVLVSTGIDRVELSGNLLPCTDAALFDILHAFKAKIRFQVHNYFPPPVDSFVLNLAHPATVERSVHHCRRAMDLCATLGARYYSVHAGWAFNPGPQDLGEAEAHLPTIDIAESRAILKDACREVADYGRKFDVGLLLENNVVAAFNCPNGVNDRHHLADPEEAGELLEIFDGAGAGVLLDTGHLTVSGATFGFRREDFIDLIGPYIRVVQISDNDGTADQNRPVGTESWFWGEIPWAQIDYVSLEVTGETLETIQEQMKLVETKLSTPRNG